MTIAEHVTFDWQGGRVVVRFAGEVDVRTVDHIGALVEEMVGCATDGPVLLDMSAATFMDAPGRGLILRSAGGPTAWVRR